MARNGDCNRNGQLDEYKVKALSTQVRNHPDWRFRETTSSFEEQVKRSVAALRTGGTVEYWSDHVETTGVLRLKLPSLKPSSPAMTGTLNQALERRQQSNPENDQFLEQLIQKHTEIAEKHSEGYISPVTDPVSIVEVQVPVGYEQERVEDALTQASKASREIQAVHDKIMEVLQDADQS